MFRELFRNRQLTSEEKSLVRYQVGADNVFNMHVWSAIFSANPRELKKIAKAFPGEVHAFKQWENGSLKEKMAKNGFDARVLM